MHASPANFTFCGKFLAIGLGNFTSFAEGFSNPTGVGFGILPPLIDAELGRVDADDAVREQAVIGVGYLGLVGELGRVKNMFHDPSIRPAALMGYSLAFPDKDTVARLRSLYKKIEKLADGLSPEEADIVRLFAARGDDFTAVTQAANRLRQQVSGDEVTLQLREENFEQHRSDVYAVRWTGGGGFGDPSGRDPEALALDLKRGFVTAARRATDYGTST